MNPASSESPRLHKKLEVDSFFNPLKEPMKRVEQRILQQAEVFDPGITGYVEYAAASSGKRLRPALVFMSAKATGECNEEHVDLAVIVELVHLASLIHDDVLDHATQRRARPTINSKWGAEISVLLGDCLFAHALKLCTRYEGNMVSRLVADAANEVCTGEILQTQRQFDLKLTVPEYLKIIGMKTAALFRVSAELAVRLNNRPEAEVEAFRAYGEAVGVAYQIYDDCLDLFGTEDGSGKTLGTDVQKGKLTLPILHMLQQLDSRQMEEFSEMLVKGDEASAVWLRKRVVSAGGHIYAVRKAQDYLERASRLVAGVPTNMYTKLLIHFADSFGRQLGELR